MTCSIRSLTRPSRGRVLRVRGVHDRDDVLDADVVEPFSSDHRIGVFDHGVEP
jgi:hypothetical protein